MNGACSIRAPSGIALSTLLVAILLLSTPAVAAAGPRLAATVSSYPLLASRTTTVAVVNGSASVDDSASTGLAVKVKGIVGAANVTFVTKSLAAPSLGEAAPQVGPGGSVTYFGMTLALPTGASFGAGAKANLCVTLVYYPTKLFDTTVEYWNGSAWAATTNQIYFGEGNNWICGDAPVSVLAETDIAAVFPGFPTATSTTSTTASTSQTTSTISTSTSVTSSSTSTGAASSTTGATAAAGAPVTLYLGIVIVAALAIAGAILAARRSRRGRGTAGSPTTQ